MIDWEKLRQPFHPKDLEWRENFGGQKCWLPYVDARAIMERLDEVVGPENWEDSYEKLDGGWLCTLTLMYREDGEGERSRFISKADGAPESNIEAFKGGISGSLKRAAVKFGIGRYLYDLPKYTTVPARLPAWALPEGFSYDHEPEHTDVARLNNAIMACTSIDDLRYLGAEIGGLGLEEEELATLRELWMKRDRELRNPNR